MGVTTNAMTMKIAIPVCRGRIAPLFDTAETFMLIDPGRETKSVNLNDQPLPDKCLFLQSCGVTTLLCGALSQKGRDWLSESGLAVHAFLSGDVREVLQAYLEGGQVGLVRYAMPGCGIEPCGQRLRQRRRWGCGFNLITKE